MAQGNDDSVVIERGSGGGVGLFVLGVAIGAGLALLFAPQPGEDTRAALARGSRKARRRARELMESARETAADTREALEERLARHHSARSAHDDGADDGA